MYEWDWIVAHRFHAYDQTVSRTPSPPRGLRAVVHRPNDASVVLATSLSVGGIKSSNEPVSLVVTPRGTVVPEVDGTNGVFCGKVTVADRRIDDERAWCVPWAQPGAGRVLRMWV